MHVEELGLLAFAHRAIIDKTIERLKDKATYTDLPANLIAKEFTIRQLRQAYEAIAGEEISRQSFAKRANKLVAQGILKETGQTRAEESGRPAKLYEYTSDGSTHIFTHVMTGPRGN